MVSLIATKECLLICFVFTNLTDPNGTATQKPVEVTKPLFPEWSWTFLTSNLISTNGNHTNNENSTAPSGDGNGTTTSFIWATTLRSTLIQTEILDPNINSNQSGTSESNGNLNQTGTSESNQNSYQTNTTGSVGTSKQTGAETNSTTTSLENTSTVQETTTMITTTTPLFCWVINLNVGGFSLYSNSFVVGNGSVSDDDFIVTNFTSADNPKQCNATSPRLISRRLKGFRNIEIGAVGYEDDYYGPLVNCENDSSPCDPYLNVSLPINETFWQVSLYLDNSVKTQTLSFFIYHTERTTTVVSEDNASIVSIESLDLLNILK